ncbi:zinc finger ZZ-type and EF-hand domain-containing protein 1 isoform X2 [Spea bombifrons]|uniref:zinc finger ZZ-type and EF-hand domain-containing protein 1 isoform X2 n=1 Tax=Spea bombifrons TaxID=233779 RepID=UPI002349945D|nr:zinc finger ZZ-type and EF-hand domain-containing protein 1 isoform X2 [Spea bombifrons]
MGNVVSGGSGDEDDPGMEQEDAGAACSQESGTSGTAPGAAALPGVPGPVSPPLLPPSPAVLLEQARLREAAARLREVGAPESVISRHQSALLRWLEERLSRGDETVSREQFIEMLESRASSREECEEAFAQFDAEGDEVVDLEGMLEAVKASSGANLQGELSHVIRQLQACSLTPGFIDIFSKSKERLGLHSSKTLRFLHRNRVPSTVIPYPILECCNNICTMRSSVLKDYLDQLLKKEKERPAVLDIKDDSLKYKTITKCYSNIETSSNSSDIDKMTNGETSSYWQSDGSARSHWIRLRLKPNVVLRHLSISVCAADQSYMPQQVAVAVGRSPSNLMEVREVHIPSHITGFVTLLENGNINQPYVQINIKRCLSDGCDTRIHGLRATGYQKVKRSAVSISDASAIWYLSLLTSLVTTSMDTNPALAQAVQQHTRKALQHMPPLSLTLGTAEFPNFLSANVLEEVNSFLLRTASCSTPDVDLNLLAFALARGNIAKVITSLCNILERMDQSYKASSLVSSMESVRMNLLYKYGRQLQFTLIACDVKGKGEKSGPENLLMEQWTGDGFLTENGKTRASIILSSGTESAFQVTQMRLRVRRGAIGAKCGLVFAYNSTDKFHAEEHFKRFEKYDSWKLSEFRQFVKERTSKSCPELEEHDPVAWFEFEEEWDEVDIQMPQCKTAQYWMVKFLCTREETAERLGVQGLSAFGYKRPLEGKASINVTCLKCKDVAEDSVCGMTLILKTLLFIQQLAHDIEKDNRAQPKSLLDFSGLDLQLLWMFYKKLHKNPREECVSAQAILLQLLLSCSSILTSGSTDKDKADQSHAAQELYQHLCDELDTMSSTSVSSKALREEISNTLLNGAAIFFPDSRTRRDRLFSLMKSITEEVQPQSAHITFKSLCSYFSEQDPSGLLLLPDMAAPADFDIGQVQSVMEKLLLMAERECKLLVADSSQGECGPILHSLFWAVQGSLLSWCYCQLKGEDSLSVQKARDLLVNYIVLFLSNTRTILEPVLQHCNRKEIIEKLSTSVFAIATRQLMTFLLEVCTLDIPHRFLLQIFSTLAGLLKNLCGDPTEGSNKEEMDTWNQVQQPVILQTWHLESPHNYENNCREKTVFLCPGATSFEVEFDDKCETERRYDYLEFIDARGGKIRYDHKVDTEKWPKKVTFKSGPQLQFEFFSDSSNNEWGYKFTVTAYGLPDIALSWASDIQLLVARLMGRLASRCMALRSTCELGPFADLSAAKVASVVTSPLWKPVFRHQMCTESEPKLPVQDPGGIEETKNSHADDCRNFLLDFANSDPTQDYCGPNSELFKGLLQAFRKQATKNDIVGGSVVDQAVNCTFAALVYLTPELYGKLQKYVLSGGNLSLSEEFAQVFALADGIRIWMLEMKQKSLHGGGSEKPGTDLVEVNPETLAKQCIEKSLLLLKFLPPRPRLSPVSCSSADDSDLIRSQDMRRKSSIVESDFQAASSSPESVYPVVTGKLPVSEPGPPKKQEADLFRYETPPGNQSKTSEKAEEPSSPPPTPTRKAPFNRARLRLLSFRSMEEAKVLPTVKEKYPILRNILDFIKDTTISHESILQVLSLRKAQAESILKVLKIIQTCLGTLGQPHFFQPSCVLFLMELLACQKDFTTYFGHLEGCGVDLHKAVREAYYRLVALLVNAVKSFHCIKDRSLLPALSCVQVALLHMMDMSWEPQDISFFVSIDLPDLLLAMSQENISTHDSVVSRWEEKDERADYRQNILWLEECKDGLFETWYEKLEQAEPDVRRKMHLFIARYCDLLNVEISCDGCDKIAPWHRYRCLQCNDMDLCKACFLGGVKPEGHEDDHEMVNMEFACDHCQGLIIGHRIHCNVCEDFDLCYGCYVGMRYSESHLPTHSVTIYPTVTSKVSDRQRLIQPYIHNYSWLLFTALALYSSDIASEGDMDGEKLDPSVVSSARVLQASCTDLVASCLMKAQKGKDLRTSSLLSVWTNGDSSLENEASSVSSFSDSIAESEKDLLPHKVPQPGDIPQKAALSHTSKDAVSEQRTAQTAEHSMVKEPQTKDLCSEGEPDFPDTYLFAGQMSNTYIVDKVITPSPDQVFAECSQERILGLIAAMLPPMKSDTVVPIVNLQQVLPLMFQVVLSNAGHLNESYHLTLGLLGQLILRLPPAEVDDAVSKVLPSKQSSPAEGEELKSLPEGWITTQLLFSLGAACLDSKVGLDWACTMSDILRALNGSSKWHNVIASYTDHCMKELPHQLKNTNIFTLLVLVGFPEVLCMGTQSVYMDNAKEPHDVIILKHFTEKNRAVVVDIKTRKRKTVKDYQLTHHKDTESQGLQDQLKKYLEHFSFISSYLLQSDLDNGSPEAVEATWVLSLALKGLYKTLKSHDFAELQNAFIQSGLLKLLVKKCSKGTGFSKTWLLRDLEILSIMLYSSKKDVSVSERKDQVSEKPEKQDLCKDEDVSGEPSLDQGEVRPDPLDGLDEATKMCFQVIHEGLNVPLHILRAIYEMGMKNADSFLQEVHKRFDENTGLMDEKVKKMAQKWQPCKLSRSEEPNLSVTDTDMIIPLCMIKPTQCEKATEETNPVSQKLIITSESDLQLSYARQRHTKSSLLLRKELDSRSKIAVRDYLYHVNEATAVVYARHVLASLLAEWPDGVPLNEDILELSGAAHITYILNMLMHLEEKQLWEKILQKVLGGCSSSMLGTVALTACQFMEEPGTAVQVRESKHPYNNNTSFEDKVHIPGAIYLSVKFDPQCNTEEGCDELVISSSSDLKQDLHRFSGPPKKWIDFELPGDTLFYRFTSDMSCTEWGYKFTVAAGHRGRFQTGFEIIKQMLSDQRVIPHLPLSSIWDWQVGVACRQTGHQRLKAIHLLLKILQLNPVRVFDLKLLKPLWPIFTRLEETTCQDTGSNGVLLPLHRALTELFFIAENRADESGCLQDYLLALTTEEQLCNYTTQALKNIAAISFAMNYPNKSTSVWTV